MNKNRIYLLTLLLTFVLLREFGIINLNKYKIETTTHQRKSSITTNLLANKYYQITLLWKNDNESLLVKKANKANQDNINNYTIALNNITGDKKIGGFIPLLKDFRVEARFNLLSPAKEIKGEIVIEKYFSIKGFCSINAKNKELVRAFKEELRQLIKYKISTNKDISCGTSTKDFKVSNIWDWENEITIKYNQGDIKEMNISCLSIFIPDERGEKWSDTIKYSPLLSYEHSFDYNVIKYDGLNQIVNSKLYYDNHQIGLETEFYFNTNLHSRSVYYRRYKIKMWDKSGNKIVL